MATLTVRVADDTWAPHESVPPSRLREERSSAFLARAWRGNEAACRVAIGAAVVDVIFPPWIIPGAGVLVLTVARCIAYHRALKPERTSISRS